MEIIDEVLTCIRLWLCWNADEDDLLENEKLTQTNSRRQILEVIPFALEDSNNYAEIRIEL